MECRDLMNREVRIVLPEQSVQEAAAIMRDANVGFLPVCNEQKQPIGTITDRDIVVRVVAAGGLGDVKVESCYTRNVVACSAEDGIAVAAARMREAHVSRMLCIDDEGRVEGVLSLSDLAQLEEGEGARTLRELSDREAHV